MDYEKAYKDAVSKIKSIIAYKKKQGLTNCLFEGDLNEIFTELAQSEDEKIRKELIDLIKDIKGQAKHVECYDRYLAWLEKQGEQKPINKVEPKFKVGDWITDGEYTWKITDIRRLDYILQSQNGDTVDDTISYVDEHFHLWTIDDAKDGDVLASKSGCPFIYKKSDSVEARFYCCVDFENYFCVCDNTSHCGFKDSSKPATKEQHDLLFQKMKEAGYEWDVEKKKLKKIEQNSAWSDEDELMFTSTINSLKLTKGACDIKIDWLKSLKNRVQPQQKQEWSMNDERILYNIHSYIDYAKDSKYHTPEKIVEAKVWLDSLENRVQPHWKPTEEQLQTLKDTINKDAAYTRVDVLESLINDIKKL